MYPLNQHDVFGWPCWATLGYLGLLLFGVDDFMLNRILGLLRRHPECGNSGVAVVVQVEATLAMPHHFLAPPSSILAPLG